ALRQVAPPPDHALVYRGKPVRFWLEQFKDADPGYRKEAAKALGVLAHKDKELAPVLVTALSDREDEVARTAITALVSLKTQAVPLLVGVLQDMSPMELKLRAAAALGEMGTAAKAAVQALAETLKE